MINYFTNKDIINDIVITPLELETIFNHTRLNKEEIDSIKLILNECKRLPASLNYHGRYRGGLFDHTLLVINFSYHLWYKDNILKHFKDFFLNKNLNFSKDYSELDLSKIIRTALYHDFGKIPYYAVKTKLCNRNIFITNKLDLAVKKEIQERFDLKGKDRYVERTIGILKRYSLPYDDEIYLSIIFHHGKWSKYKPPKGNKLSELIHLADMIASNYYYI